MKRKESTFRLYLCLAWLAGITALSFYYWGSAVKPGAWLGSWIAAFFDALISLPAVVLNEPGILWGMVVVAACALCGRSIMARLMDEPPPLSVSFAAGMVVLAFVFALAGSVGLFRPAFLIIFTLSAAAGGLWDLIFILPPKNFSARRYRLQKAELVILSVPLLIVLVSILNPTWFYDALNYHLALPRQYLISGFTDPVAWHPYSFFPSCGEMVLGAGLVGGVLSAQIISGGVWLFCVLVLRDTAVRHISERSGPAVLGVSLATLTITKIALQPGIDHFVLLLTVGGLFFLCGFLESSSEEKKRLTGLVIGWGLMAGGAAAVKYTAWLQVLLVQLFFLAVLTIKYRHLRDILPGLAVAVLVLLPWPLRNLAASGNPVMPVPVDGIWQGLTESAWQTFRTDAHAVKLSLSSLPEVIAAPWNMVFGKWEELAREWGAAHFIGPLLWMSVPVFLVAGKKDRKLWLILVYGLIALYLAVASFRMVRFAYPGIGALILAGGAGIHALWTSSFGKPVIKTFTLIVLAAAFLLCAGLFFKATANLTGGYSYPRLQSNKQRYIERILKVTGAPPTALPLQLKASRRLPEDARVLMAGETRFFYLKQETVAPYFLVPHPLFELLKQTTFQETAERLEGFGFTHLLVSIPEMERLRQRYEKTGHPPPNPERVQAFVESDYCEMVLQDPDRGSSLCRFRAKLPDAH